jgi:hypothetical protein
VGKAMLYGCTCSSKCASTYVLATSRQRSRLPGSPLARRAVAAAWPGVSSQELPPLLSPVALEQREPFVEGVGEGRDVVVGRERAPQPPGYRRDGARSRVGIRFAAIAVVSIARHRTSHPAMSEIAYLYEVGDAVLCVCQPCWSAGRAARREVFNVLDSRFIMIRVIRLNIDHRRSFMIIFDI